MKKIHTILAATLLATSLLQAAPAERIYVSTDRNIYLAGEDVWCSLFLVDTKTGSFSNFSAVAYMELVSTDGTAAEAKIAIVNGRGAGRFRIPSGTPSGNYRLMSYTAQNANEESNLSGSKILSIFNTSSVSRVKGGTTLLSEEEYNAINVPDNSPVGPVDIILPDYGLKHGNSIKFGIKNNGAFPVSLSVSVHECDGNLIQPANDGPEAFYARLNGNAGIISEERLAEYEGEIISARIKDAPDWTFVTLSTAGSVSDIYIGRTDDNGVVRFFTNNIYGDRELVCEAPGIENADIRFIDPFIHPSPGEIKPLVLSPAQRDALLKRKSGLSAGFVADTLLSFLPRRQDLLLDDINPIIYHLDDYVRFDTFKEVVVEILQEIKIRTVRGRREILMVIPDASGSRKNLMDNILVLMDGVSISDIRLLEEMDANLIEDVIIYPRNISIGSTSFNGVVNFITRNKLVKALHFPSSVVVTDFLGVCYPVSYTGGFNSKGYLLYWNPVAEISSGETLDVLLGVPEKAGKYLITAEGFGEGGIPVSITKILEIQ